MKQNPFINYSDSYCNIDSLHELANILLGKSLAIAASNNLNYDEIKIISESCKIIEKIVKIKQSTNYHSKQLKNHTIEDFILSDE